MKSYVLKSSFIIRVCTWLNKTLHTSFYLNTEEGWTVSGWQV